MKLNTRIAASMIAVAALAAAGTSWAHPGGMGYGHGPGMGHPMGYGMGPGGGHRMGPGMGPGMGARGNATDAEAAVAARLASLKVQLKITAAQEGAWASFEKQAREQATSQFALRQQMQEQMHGPQAQPRSAPDVAALRESMARLRQANAEKHTAALTSLYAALTPEQKARADRQLGGPGFAGGPGRGMGKGRGCGAGWGPGA